MVNHHQRPSSARNPYNARKKVISKPLMITTLGCLLIFWIAFNLFLTKKSSTDTVKNRHPKHEEMHWRPQTGSSTEKEATTSRARGAKRKEDEQQQQPVAKKTKKNKHDFRSIKIETPPPKQKHVGESRNTISEKVKNLTASNPIYKGREKIVGMLTEMYIDVTQIDDEVWAKVPVWSEVEKIHGRRPAIYGLDTCENFRETVPAIDRHVMIAGMFNTGTNLLSILLQHNVSHTCLSTPTV